MSKDISELLSEWPYDEEANIRRIIGMDGREKLQVRLQMGLEQYEVNGRPDGRTIRGYDSYLAYYQAVAEKVGEAWEMGKMAFQHLYDEGLLYYCRYLLFFKIGDYALCARDTARNLKLADFVLARACDQELLESLEQYRPYMVRMHAVSVAIMKAKKGDLEGAIQMLTGAVDKIEALQRVNTQVFRLEKTRSLVALRDLKHQLIEQKSDFSDGQTSFTEVEETVQSPLSRLEILQQELNEAVETENYERAAQLRDKIKQLLE